MKEFDDIKIPENLTDYIDKGIEKGIEYKSKNKKKTLIKVASIGLISGITLTTVSNIPVLAKELVDVPIIGELVKVLDFNENSQYGGVITDGNRIVIDTLDKNSINIYFSDNGKLANNTPHYEVEYREYPYTLVFTFSGVRYLDSTYVKDKVEKLPFVKDVYNIVRMDDSGYRVAIELNNNIEFKVIEYKEPAMIRIKVKPKIDNKETKEAYFIRTVELEPGEQVGLIEESLYGYNKVGIQKTSSEKYIVQLGPYKTKEEANKELENIMKTANIDAKLFIESRKLGEGTK